MNQIMKSLMVAGAVLLILPSTLLAQKEKEEKDKKEKEKKELQQIIITRTGNTEGKTTIEIDGDKVKVNGQDVKDNKDVSVRVNKVRGANVYRLNTPQGAWSYSYDDDHMSLFSEDENRAMLGVETEGDDKGARIASVIDESGAEKAGLKKGDVITRIDDKKIESTDDVTETIKAHKPGEKVKITYLRDDKEQTATAELGKWKGFKMNALTAPRMNMGNFNLNVPEPPMVFNGGGNFYVAGRPKLGLSIQDTDDGVGVKVIDVDDDSNAAKAGLKEGDIIVGVDDHEVKGTEDVTHALRDGREKNSFMFKVQRNGKTQNIEVKMPRKLKTAEL